MVEIAEVTAGTLAVPSGMLGIWSIRCELAVLVFEGVLISHVAITRMGETRRRREGRP